jgi:predicted peptidase
MRRLSMLLAVSLLLCCAAPALAQEDPYQPVPDYNRRQDGVAYAVPKTVTYFSSTCGMDRKCNVYLPADYDESKSYPLLLLLHGIGGDHKEWMGGVPEIIIGNLIAAGKTKEMIIVTPDIKGLVIFAVIVAVALIFKKIRKKPISPILLILISAGLGIVMYS